MSTYDDDVIAAAQAERQRDTQQETPPPREITETMTLYPFAKFFVLQWLVVALDWSADRLRWLPIVERPLRDLVMRCIGAALSLVPTSVRDLFLQELHDTCLASGQQRRITFVHRPTGRRTVMILGAGPEPVIEQQIHLVYRAPAQRRSGRHDA